MIALPDLGQCVVLERLETMGDYFSDMSMDLSMSRYLKVLKLWDFGALTAIQGMGGFQFLTRLELRRCSAMKGVVDLGCLKALTHLNLVFNGVEEIARVQELCLLTHLYLNVIR